MAQEKTRMNSGQLGGDLIQLKNLKKVITLSMQYKLFTLCNVTGVWTAIWIFTSVQLQG